MKKLLVSMTTAMAVLGVGVVASAAVYPPPVAVTNVSASSPVCPTDVPLVNYSVTINRPYTGQPITLTFRNIATNAVVGTTTVTSLTGAVTYPGGSGTPPSWPGWELRPNGWFRTAAAPDLSVTASLVLEGATVQGTANISYPSLAEQNQVCPLPSQEQLPPPQPAPPPPAPPPAVLPPTGLSTFETAMRLAAMLLIGGLGFVIVARRRRFASTAAA